MKIVDVNSVFICWALNCIGSKFQFKSKFMEKPFFVLLLDILLNLLYSILTFQTIFFKLFFLEDTAVFV